MNSVPLRLLVVSALGVAFGIGYFTGKSKGEASASSPQLEGKSSLKSQGLSSAPSNEPLSASKNLQPLAELKRDFDVLTSQAESVMSYAELAKQAQVLKEIAAQDPELALHLAMQDGMLTTDATIADLLKIWALESPEKAWEWTVAQDFDQAHLVLEDIANANPELARSLLQNFEAPTREMEMNLYTGLVKGFVHNGSYQQALAYIEELDVSAAEELASELGDDNLSTSDLYGLMGHLTSSMVKFDPEAGLAYLDSLPESESSLVAELRPDLLEEWALTKPQEALPYALSLPQGEERTSMLEASLVRVG